MLVLHLEVHQNRLKGLNIIVMRHNEREVLLEVNIWEGPYHIQPLLLVRYVLASSLKVSNYASHSSHFRSTSIEFDFHPL